MILKTIQAFIKDRRLERMRSNRDKLKRQLEGVMGTLRVISGRMDMTMAFKCCATKTCKPVLTDQGEQISECSRQYGVTLGFNKSATDARLCLDRVFGITHR